MNEFKQKLSLDRPGTYLIKIPGVTEKSWSDWDGVMKVEYTRESDGYPITILTFIGDQAALQGFLRRLYFLGLPLISVNWVAFAQ